MLGIGHLSCHCGVVKGYMYCGTKGSTSRIYSDRKQCFQEKKAAQTCLLLHGVQRWVVLVDGFFDFLELLFFANLLLHVA